MGEIDQPGGEPTQSLRGGGERCRQLTMPSPSRGGGRIVFVTGLVTSQCPIIPAWRSDRIKSELLYLLYVAMYLRSYPVTPIEIEYNPRHWVSVEPFRGQRDIINGGFTSQRVGAHVLLIYPHPFDPRGTRKKLQ